MTAEVLAEWLRRQGHHIVRTPSSLWYDAGPRVYEAFPHHHCIQPPAGELRALLRSTRAVALRYSAPFDAADGKVSYHVVYEGASYDLATLTGNARSKVQRGLRRCHVERIPLERLAEEGWRLQEDTLARQGRRRALDRRRWRRLSLAARDLPGFEAWGATVGGELAATVLTACVEDACYLFYPQSDRRHFTSYVNNALVYTVSRTSLARPGIRSLFYGHHSLDAPPSVDAFKFHMGYRPRPVRQRIVVHPWARPFCNRLAHATIRWLLARRLAHPLVAKAEGMLRFYLEGQRPAEEQTWPECLVRRQTA